MSKMNCWEFKKCGREPGGAKAIEMGVCSAAAELRTEGIHGGKCGGRACWMLAGTLCGGKVQGTYAMKLVNCMECEFYKIVCTEEKGNIVSATQILNKLK